MTNKEAKSLRKLEAHYSKMLHGEKPMSTSFKHLFDLLNKGTCTVCTLPHYRYQTLACLADNLKNMGWIVETGRTKTSVNYVQKRSEV